jgi:curved DNA-binding protein CbpA
MSLSENLYQLLGIDPSATLPDIRRAYAKKLREFPVEEYPEQFQKIRRAYEILGDEQSRQSYDKTLRNNGTYGKELERAKTVMLGKNYSLALSILQDLLCDFPGDKDIRYQKSICLLNLQRNYEAKTALLELTMEEPGNTEYQYSLAHVYTENKEWQSAARTYEKLVQLMPEESNYYLELSYCYTEQQQYSSAANALEKRLRSKGETVQDFPLLSELYFLAMVQNQSGYRNEIVSRIRALPDNSKEKQNLLMMIINLCQTITNNPEALKEFYHLAKSINNHEFNEVNEWLNEHKRAVEQMNESGNQTASTYEASSGKPSARGSIIMAIIIGIVFSFITTPIGGLIAGFAFYFYGKAILKLLGCLILIIIVIGIIFAAMSK